uniref:SUEL-type lectin domain-containing protein n=1 Tax=Neogobius melanostomus TaxID=47308 RepID=A0A8C6SII0_9GOBI
VVTGTKTILYNSAPDWSFEQITAVTVLKCGPCGLNAVSLSDSGKVIRIHRADYGRSDSITCSQDRPAEQLQNVNSAAQSEPVTLIMETLWGHLQYLQVSYSCERKCGSNAVSLSDSGKVIHIHSAVYGRSNSTTCSQGRPAEQLQNVNCAASTTNDHVAQMCNGKSHCSVTASPTVYGDPCVGTDKYLQVSYSCERSSIGE